MEDNERCLNMLKKGDFPRRSDIAPYRIHVFADLEQLDEYRAKLVSFGARVHRGVKGVPRGGAPPSCATSQWRPASSRWTTTSIS